MQLLQNTNLDFKRMLKIGGLVLIAIILITLAVKLVGSTFNSFTRKGTVSMDQAGLGGDRFGVSYSGIAGNYAEDAAFGKSAGLGMPTLSVRNIAPMPPTTGGTTGSDAEAYEVTEYHGTIETRRKDEVCESFFDLKAKDYVIFEQSNSYDQGCNFTFKVTSERVDEVVAFVKALDPKTFVENRETIKRQVEDFTSQIDILLRKQESIEDTLEKATTAYDEITMLARQTGNADSLANVITSKISIIERLTQERINVSTQLDQLTRAKSQQLDKLDYTYFYVSVVENKYLDGQQLKDSWKVAVREFVRDVNKIAQDVSVTLVTVFLWILQYLLYAFIILIIAKHAWRLAKRIWKGHQQMQ